MSGTTLLWPWPAAPGTRTKTGHSSLIISILRWSLRTFSYFYIYYWKLPSEQENKAIQKSSSNHPQLLHCAELNHQPHTASSPSALLAGQLVNVVGHQTLQETSRVWSRNSQERSVREPGTAPLRQTGSGDLLEGAVTTQHGGVRSTNQFIIGHQIDNNKIIKQITFGNTNRENMAQPKLK